MHVRRERVNLSSQVNTSKLFEFKTKLNAAPDAGEDDLDFNIDSNFMNNLNENINLYIYRGLLFLLVPLELPPLHYRLLNFA
jgi:hypothetical protein